MSGRTSKRDCAYQLDCGIDVVMVAQDLRRVRVGGCGKGNTKKRRKWGPQYAENDQRLEPNGKPADFEMHERLRKKRMLKRFWTSCIHNIYIGGSRNICLLKRKHSDHVWTVPKLRRYPSL